MASNDSAVFAIFPPFGTVERQITELAADGRECCDVARGVAIWLTYALDDDACRGQDAPDDVSCLCCGENRIFGICTGCCVSLGGLLNERQYRRPTGRQRHYARASRIRSSEVAFYLCGG